MSTISIGQTIRRLRKERNLTQEELAAQLNITSQAVSRWESETGLPDISQIVPLANVFGVSTDVLFGTFGVDNDAEVEKIIEEAYRAGKSAYNSEQQRSAREYTYECLQEGLKTYPNNLKLLQSTLSNGVCMLGYYNKDSEDAEEKRRFQDIYSECRRAADVILNSSRDLNDLQDTHGWLVLLYTKSKEFDKAEEQIAFLPQNRGVSTIIHHNDPEKEIETRCENIFSYLRNLEFEIAWLSIAYRNQGKIEDAYSVCRTFYDTICSVYGEYTYRTPFFTDEPYQGRLASFALRLGRPDEALDWLERMYNDTMAMAENWKKGVHFDVPLLRGVKQDMHMEAYNVRPKLLHVLNEKVFDPIRDTDRFQSILAKVKAFPDLAV